MVATNHPLASAAGAQMLLEGGNAFDAAAAALFALTVVEPMMVGVLGGGVIHLRTRDGRHRIIDGLSTAPAGAREDMFKPVGPGRLPNDRETEGRRNALGGAAAAVPGALPAWLAMHGEHGSLPIADILAPAIRLAERGFAATPYLADCVTDSREALARDSNLSRLFLPGGEPLRAGMRLIQPEYAETLKLIARDGARALQGGPLGMTLAQALAGTAAS